MKMKCLGVHLPLSALALVACHGDSSLGNGPKVASNSGGAAGAGGSGQADGSTPDTDGNNDASSGSGGSSAGAAGGNIDSGAADAGHDAEAGPKIDPRFRLIEPLAPPTEWVTGTMGNRVHHTLLPTDVAVGITDDVLWASDDLSVIVGTSTRNIRHPPGDSVGSFGQTYVWTEASGTRGIDSAPALGGDYPVGMSSDASVIYGVRVAEDGQGSVFRWSSNSNAVLGLPVGSSALNLSFTPPHPTFWGPANVAQNGSVLVAADADGVMRWTEASGWVRLTDSSWGLVAMSQTGNEVLLEGGASKFRWWSPATGILDISPPLGFASNECTARLMTPDGSTVVGQCLHRAPPYPSTLFRWTPANGSTSLGPAPPNSDFLTATLMSSDGSVVTGIIDTTDAFGARPQVYRYTQTGGVSIIYDPKFPTQFTPDVTGMSRDGRVIYGTVPLQDGSGSRPFVWREGSGLASNVVNTPTIASRDGTVLAGLQVPDSQNEIAPFIMDAKGERDIAKELTAAGVDLGGFRLYSVVLVESGTDIRIVGTGVYPGTDFPPANLPGESRAWVARLPIRQLQRCNRRRSPTAERVKSVPPKCAIAK